MCVRQTHSIVRLSACQALVRPGAGRPAGPPQAGPTAQARVQEYLQYLYVYVYARPHP